MGDPRHWRACYVVGVFLVVARKHSRYRIIAIMKRGILWVILASLVGFGGIWSANAATFNSSNFSINGNLGDSTSGGQSSTNYQLTSAGGESIAGQSSSGSYKLGQGYISTLENSLELRVLPNGLVGYWSFDQGQGSTVVDDSSNNTPATMVGAPTYTAGKIGQAMTGFVADTNYLTASNNSAYNVSALTSCVWMNLANTTTNPIAFARAAGTPDTDGMWSIGFSSGRAPRVRLHMNGTTNTLLSPSNVTLGTWNHVCMTYDGSTLALYQNGDNVIDQPLTGAMSSFSRVVSFGTHGSGGQPLDGSIDEAKLFSRALSASEIKAEYDAGNAGNQSGLGLNNITPGVSQTSLFDSVIQTSSGGYTLAINQNTNLTNGAATIPGVSGSIASPVSWSEGVTKGLGFTLYNTNATAIPGTWASGASYAALPASATSFYTRSGYTGGSKDIVNMRLRLDAQASQLAGSYTNQMIITGTMVP